MTLKPIHTRRGAQPVDRRTDRRPLQQREPNRLVAAEPLAPTFARRRRQAAR